MDCNKISTDQGKDDSFSFYPLSIRASPNLPHFSLNRDCMYPFGFYHSPIIEPQVLSRSLTLNELEELDNGAENPANAETTRENSLKEEKKGIQLYFNNKPYGVSGVMELEDAEGPKKRESMFSMKTQDSESFMDTNDHSPVFASESRVLVNIKDNEAFRNHIQNVDIKADKNDRRMSSIVLNRFNAFSLGSPLLSRSNSDNKNLKSAKKGYKRISKPKSNKNTESKKTKQKEVNNSVKSLNKFTDIETQSKISNQPSTNINISADNLKDSISELPTKIGDLSISIEQPCLVNRSD